ncbi:DNA methyltransferase [Parvimonas micra]|uniref:site-specific DNA-methyltransferase (adenine-specific) n=1 Tax=Parvimonas micra TaxID=33033 RepID=A0A9X3HKY3_9FIRM|nr:DNA methyltransferase [Parvimonas micra]MCZ7408220.1 DNA methyltransferase [Parvimonas micra]MCZ7410147.1 DNA methyltransferase [Parvimonas micra]MCZ7411976.1 DNA methyltransferase [Parvimonas micra]WBB37055.1 DNA methyltransferase [Parvimonas micra]
MEPIKILNYQGSKASLMPFISNNISKYISPKDKICDIFAGSGIVGAHLSDSYSVVANDAELYSSIIASSLLNIPSTSFLLKAKESFFKGYKANFRSLLSSHEDVVAKERAYLISDSTSDLISLYKAFPTIWNGLDKAVNYKQLGEKNRYNLFLYYYSGSYFGIEQSIQIDAIIKTIHEIDAIETQNILFSCLFYSMNETVFSKDGHMAQPLSIEKNSIRHLKQRKKNIITYFESKLDEFIKKSPKSGCIGRKKVFNLDISTLLKSPDFQQQNFKLIYADPPYTDMQYSRFYHLLNVAANYNYPKPTIVRGKFTKGLYVEGRNQSALSKKSTAKTCLEKLFKYCNDNNIVLALSYAYPKDKVNQKTNRYTISIEELVELAKSIFGSKKVQIELKDYKHANNRNSFAKEVFEYLILCGKELHSSRYDLFKLKKEIKTIKPTSKNSVYNTHLYWSQKSFNVIDSLITHLSYENDIIFDPFLGSGVTVLEAVNNNLNRIGIGCDVNEMSKFITNNILNEIPRSDLNQLFSRFKKKLSALLFYYETQCDICGKTGTISKVVFDKPDRTGNKFKIKAISYTCPHCGKKVKASTEDDYLKFSTTKNNKFVLDMHLIQNSKIAVGVSDKISDIFTPRNFSVLNEIVGYIQSIDNSSDRNVLKYLLMSILHLSKITDTHSNSQWPLWIPKINCVEKNIIDLLQRRMYNMIKAQKYIRQHYSNTKMVSSYSELKTNNALVLTKGSQHITNQDIPDDSVSLIITDPPYMDQVLYSEYMQLYSPFIGTEFNLNDEIVVSSAPKRNKGKEEYFSLLFKVFEVCKRKLKENNIMCLYFHDSNLDVWVKLLQILEANGFKYISQEHIKKTKTVKNILSPKKSLGGDAVLFFENTRQALPSLETNVSINDIKDSVVILAKKLLEKHGDLSTPELYDLGIMEMLIENSWLAELSKRYKSLVEIFEEYFIWKKESAKWHLQS